MQATERQRSERSFHDWQARQRAVTFQRRPQELPFDDDSYLDHETWIRPALEKLGDLRHLNVLDFGCGHGMAGVVLARRGARLTAFDLSLGYLDEARRRAQANGVAIHFVQANGQRLPFADGSFDAITFTYVLRYVSDPAATIAELARALRPAGVMAGLDFYVPPHPLARAAWWLYTRAVLPVAGFVLGGRAWWDVGRFLGPNISAHYRRWPLERLLEAWDAAGMEGVEYRQMSLGGGIVMWGTKRA